MSNKVTILDRAPIFTVAPPEKTNKDVVSKLKAELADVRDKIAILEKKGRDPKAFLPVERGQDTLSPVIDQLEEMEERIKEDLETAIFVLRGKEEHIAMAKMGYPNRLDLKFLEATKIQSRKRFGFTVKDVWPAFIVVDVTDSDRAFTFRAFNNIYGNTSVRTNLPGDIEKYFATTIGRLEKITPRETETVLRAEYRGLLPDALRSEIQNHLQAKTFDRIFIIAEAPEWKLDVIVRTPPDDDPIVVGWKEYTRQAFIIGVYDPTRLEQYIADQCGFSITIP